MRARVLGIAIAVIGWAGSAGEAWADTTCSGQLFEHDTLLPPSRGPEIHREVDVTCTVPYKLMGPDLFHEFYLRFPTTTNALGHFSVDVWIPPEGHIYTIGDAVATCSDEQCGREIFSIAQPLSVFGDFQNVDIQNVGLVVHEGTMARRLTMGSTPAERNDLPIIVVEDFDPGNDLGTNAALYLFSGQPKSFQWQDGEPCPGVGEDGGCILRPCTPDPLVDPVGPCQPTTGAFFPMLFSGYDVWVVDIYHGDQTVFDNAKTLPYVIGEISRFTGELNRVAVLGLGRGGLVARAALHMWQRPFEWGLPRGSVERSG